MPTRVSLRPTLVFVTRQCSTDILYNYNYTFEKLFLKNSVAYSSVYQKVQVIVSDQTNLLEGH